MKRKQEKKSLANRIPKRPSIKYSNQKLYDGMTVYDFTEICNNKNQHFFTKKGKNILHKVSLI